MINETDLFDINAEFLLNYLYPDQTDQWQAECAGTFYRNYSPDILSIEKDKTTVRLARDGFLRLLPQGIIAPDNALKGKDFEQKYEQLKKKEELLKDLFKPILQIPSSHRKRDSTVVGKQTYPPTEAIFQLQFRRRKKSIHPKNSPATASHQPAAC